MKLKSLKNDYSDGTNSRAHTVRGDVGYGAELGPLMLGGHISPNYYWDHQHLTASVTITADMFLSAHRPSLPRSCRSHRIRPAIYSIIPRCSQAQQPGSILL